MEWFFYRDLLPFVALVGKECGNTGLHTLFKAATLRGMSHHVFVTYAYAVATIVLLPVPFCAQRRSRVVPPLSFSLVSKITLLGLLGSSNQMLWFAGINYSTPTLASAISNLVPAITFLFAIIFRMEKIAVKSTSSQAKVLGSIVSISGAFLVIFYKGPSVIIAHDPLSFSLQQPLSILGSVDTSWVNGGLLLMLHALLLSLWYILQVEILKVYPDELSVVFFYNLSATIFAGIVALFTETNASAWKIGFDISLISVVSSGIFTKFISNLIDAWALNIKGPVYVSMFKPLSIVIAVAMGIIFLGDALYIGSLVGGTIISFGFYSVIWGKAIEEKEKDDVCCLESPSTSSENVPLLQSYTSENPEKKIDSHV